MSINPEYGAFLGLPANRRIKEYEIVAEKIGALPEYIEKDLWTCHVLDALFNADVSDRPRLLFKGGTSLSKVYDAIQRFSEDVDITVFRQDMEFAGDADPANPEMSNSRRRKLVERLVGKTAEYIQGDLRNTLTSCSSCMVGIAVIEMKVACPKKASACQDTTTMLAPWL